MLWCTKWCYSFDPVSAFSFFFFPITVSMKYSSSLTDATFTSQVLIQRQWLLAATLFLSNADRKSVIIATLCFTGQKHKSSFPWAKVQSVVSFHQISWTHGFMNVLLYCHKHCCIEEKADRLNTNILAIRHDVFPPSPCETVQPHPAADKYSQNGSFSRVPICCAILSVANVATPSSQ